MNLAPALLDVPRKRVGQRLGSAVRNRLAIHVHGRDHDVEGLAGTLLLGQDLRRKRPVEHHRPHEVVLEILLHPGAGGEREFAQPQHALRTAFESLREQARWRRGREERLDEAVADQAEIVVDLAVARSILGRVPGDRGHGLVNAAVDDKPRTALPVGVPGDRVCGPQIIEPVALKFGEHPIEVRIGVNPYVRGAEQVVLEPREGDLPRDRASPDPGISLHDTDGKARACQPRAAGEAVHAGPRYHHIVGFCHARIRSKPDIGGKRPFFMCDIRINNRYGRAKIYNCGHGVQ